MVECVGLENRYSRKAIEGSNPSLSVSPSSLFVAKHSQMGFCGVNRIPKKRSLVHVWCTFRAGECSDFCTTTRCREAGPRRQGFRVPPSWCMVALLSRRRPHRSSLRRRQGLAIRRGSDDHEISLQTLRFHGRHIALADLFAIGDVPSTNRPVVAKRHHRLRIPQEAQAHDPTGVALQRLAGLGLAG